MRPRTTLLLILHIAAATVSSSASTTGHGGLRQRHRRADNSTGTAGCWAHERDALLEFKRGITSDPAGILDSWQPRGQRRDCCRWRGVRCSNYTGHVSGLNLRNVYACQKFPKNYEKAALVGQISPSLLSLHHMKHLDLSLNELQGPSGRLPEFLGSLKNLRYLNLSNIKFHGEVPSQLGNLTNLQDLDLSCTFLNKFEDPNVSCSMKSTDISWLTRLPSLRVLNMGSVDLRMVLDWPHVVNMVPSLVVLDLSFCSLTSANQSLPHLNLTKLERLHLSNNYFRHPVASCWFWNLTSLRYLEVGGTFLNGQFPYVLGGMTSLQALDFSESYSIHKSIDVMTANMTNLCSLEVLGLSYNYIDGNITQLFDGLAQCPLKMLKELYLNDNNFTGVLPDSVGRWASLLTLDLSNNQITGNLPSEIGMLSNLTGLYLDSNNVNGLVTHKHLGGLKSLKGLDLSGNSLKIVLDSEWSPPFRLQYAYLSSCAMGPQFPTWLQSQVDIIHLEMSGTAIFDNLPDWFCTTFSNARKLNISNNRISGTLPANIEVMASLAELYLNSNQLTGQIPKLPEGLVVMDISRNSLSGALPSNFGAPFIRDLRLFSNHINGHVPQSMCQLQYLDILDLADNLFEGELPPCFKPSSLRMLIASNNRFSGKFPPSSQICTNLYVLDLARNNFSGELPVWIGDLVNIEIVRLNYNNFSGSIPTTITKLTKLLHLNLAGNSISGVLPWHLSNLTGMTARGNPTTFGHYVPIMNMTVDTKGHERYYDKGQIFRMLNIDISSNFLTGEIPEEVTSLDGVRNLNLSRNNFSGKIPVNIGEMQSLESLDLSESKLYGELPHSLSKLTFLSYLNLAHNDFTGILPSGGQLETLYYQNPSMFDGNIGLCGYFLHKNCTYNSEPNKHGDHKRDPYYICYPNCPYPNDGKYLVSFPFGPVVGYVVGLWSVFCVIIFKQSWRIAYFRFLDRVQDKVYVFVIVAWARWAQKETTN